MVQTRGPTGSLRRVTIGRDTKMTAEAARRTAAEVIDRISSGEDPFPAPPTPEPTVADLAERYMKAHVEVNCRPGTVERDTVFWDRELKGFGRHTFNRAKKS